MNDKAEFVLQRKPSRQLAMLLLIVHVGSFGLLWPLAVPLWIKVMITGLLIMSFIYYLRQEALLTSDAAITVFTLTAEQKCIITTHSGTIINGSLLANSFVSPYLTLILIQPQGKWRTHSIVLLPDSLDAESFRRLRVRLRWQSIVQEAQ